jgi:hypothetical protein
MDEETKVLKQGEELEEQEDQDSKNPLRFIRDRRAVFIVIAIAVIGIIFVAVYMSFNKQENEYPEDVTQTETGEYEGETEYIPTFTYTQEEIEQLRAYGYTADEIEQSQFVEKPAEVLYEEAKQAIKEEQQKVIDELSDTASPAYQDLFNKTWLSGTPMNLVATEDYTLEGFIENVDYIKLPAVGNQLFLRLTLADGSYLFMTVTPERWFELRDIGNIVVRYVKWYYNGEEVITEISEIIP